MALLRRIVDRNSPQAYGVMKSVLQTWTNFAMLHAEMARDVTARVWTSDEFRERAEAFLDGEGSTPRSFGGVRPNDR